MLDQRVRLGKLPVNRDLNLAIRKGFIPPLTPLAQPHEQRFNIGERIWYDDFLFILARYFRQLYEVQDPDRDFAVLVGGPAFSPFPPVMLELCQILLPVLLVIHAQLVQRAP